MTESTDVEQPGNDGSGEDRRRQGLFISYRRGETSGQARAIFEHLCERFGDDRVFMDVDSIAPGTDFVTRIEEAIDSSAVVLALIGRDWMSRGGDAALLDDPSDFIRLELTVAMQRQRPTIPVLVERAPMPDPDRLPEALRPIARINALELENGRWDFDLSRLDATVDRFLDRPSVRPPSTAPAPPPLAGAEAPLTTAAETTTKRRTPRWLVPVAAVVVVVAVVLALVIPHLTHHTTPAKPVDASAPVAKVPPDRLVDALLGAAYPAADVPSGSTASAPHLAALHFPDLDADVYVPVSGPAIDILFDYEVYDSTGDASSSFASAIPLTSGMKVSGSFSVHGMGDPTTCAHGEDAKLSVWGSGCLTEANKVLVFIEATSVRSDAASDDALVSALDLGAIRHLATVAARAPRTAPVVPPGQLAPSALYDQLQSAPYSAALLPTILPTPTTSTVALPASLTAGLVEPDVIVTSFAGPDTFDVIDLFVFTSDTDATTLYNNGLSPNGTKFTGTLDATGSSLPTRCDTFTATSGKATGYISCFVLDGDVVIESRVADSPALSVSDGAIAVTLARMGVLHVAQAASS